MELQTLFDDGVKLKLDKDQAAVVYTVLWEAFDALHEKHDAFSRRDTTGIPEEDIFRGKKMSQVIKMMSDQTSYL